MALAMKPSVRETPPRVRGEGDHSACEGEDVRNTPARAGRGIRGAMAPADSGKHPRACGERGR